MDCSDHQLDKPEGYGPCSGCGRPLSWNCLASGAARPPGFGFRAQPSAPREGPDEAVTAGAVDVVGA